MSRKNVKNILIVHGLVISDATMTEAHLKAIRQAAPDAELFIVRNKEEWELQAGEFAPKTEVVFGQVPPSRFKELPNLKWMQQIGAGADWLMNYPEIRQSELILTNASGVHIIPISEHILALMLGLARGIPLAVRRQTERVWDRSLRSVEVEGSVMGLVGVGQIGRKTAEKARALNMKTLGLRRNPGLSEPFINRMFGPDGLKEMLALSDWVVITAAYTPETRGMIGLEEFRAMKKTAYIINIARGSIIREPDLITALDQGLIAGAGLDVFEQEPLPLESPLWNMENVIITPHCAGATPHYLDRLVGIFTKNLELYQAGEPMINVVDKQLGY